MPLKAVSGFAAVSNPDNLAGLLPYHGCQQIDALNHPLQIVLGWTIEQANLHIHYNNCIHGLFPQFQRDNLRELNNFACSPAQSDSPVLAPTRHAGAV
jgi:hypothetical protein